MSKTTPKKIESRYPYLDRIDLADEEWDIWKGSYTNGVDSEAPVAKEPELPEAVDHPSHYHADSGIEVIDAIEAWGLGFAVGNVVKYCARAGHKSVSAREDLQKALWYLTWELSKYEDE